MLTTSWASSHSMFGLTMAERNAWQAGPRPSVQLALAVLLPPRIDVAGRRQPKHAPNREHTREANEGDHQRVAAHRGGDLERATGGHAQNLALRRVVVDDGVLGN